MRCGFGGSPWQTGRRSNVSRNRDLRIHAAPAFVVEPSAKTGIHHHGEQDTVVYVLEGEACVRWGDFGEYSATVRAGDFLHVPSWLPHQELNPSTEHPFLWVVVRSTPEPVVVNLPDDFWTPTDPNR